MFSTIRRHLRLSPAGAIAVIALVFAMVGGALAANNSNNSGASASAKAKRGPKGPKGATGPAGPAGAQGPAGAAGAKGDAGPAGAAGATGATGPAGPKGATGATGAAGEDGEPGATGPTGPAGPFGSTLPSGKSEYGSWSIDPPARKFGTSFETVSSFTFPLTSSPAGHFIPVGGTPPEGCSGSAANPEAEPGNLCVFEAFGGEGEFVFFYDPELPGEEGVSKFGATAAIAGGAEEPMGGTWAVTAE